MAGKRLAAKKRMHYNTESCKHVSGLFENHRVACLKGESRIVGVAVLEPGRVCDHAMSLENGGREQVYS